MFLILQDRRNLSIINKNYATHLLFNYEIKVHEITIKSLLVRLASLGTWDFRSSGPLTLKSIIKGHMTKDFYNFRISVSSSNSRPNVRHEVYPLVSPIIFLETLILKVFFHSEVLSLCLINVTIFPFFLLSQEFVSVYFV